MVRLSSMPRWFAPTATPQKTSNQLSIPYGVAARYRNVAPLSLPWAQRLQAGLACPWRSAVSRRSALTLSWSGAVQHKAIASLPWVSRPIVGAASVGGLGVSLFCRCRSANTLGW
jgi:hypothetical protein